MQISPIEKTPKRPLRFGEVNLTWQDFLFIVIANLSVVLVIVNAILAHTGFWCHYPILAMFYGYVIACASLSGSAKKFLSKFRIGVFSLNLILMLASLIHYFASGKNQSALIAYEWVLPLILTVTLGVMIGTVFFKTVTLLNLLLSITLMLPHVTGIFITALINPDGMFGEAALVLSIVNFALYLMVIVNLAFLYFVKVKNKIDDAVSKEV